MKIVFANDYPMQDAAQLSSQGLYPAHHLWGIDALRERGVDVHVLRGYGTRLSRLSRQARWRVGDLAQELDAAMPSHRGAIAYAASPGPLRGLAMLRNARLWRRPIVAVVHQPEPRVARYWLRGYDYVICISAAVARVLIEGGLLPRSRVGVLPWGPDLRFEGYAAGRSDYVVCAGVTNRDPDLLRRAVHGTDVPLRVVAGEATGFRRYDEVVSDLRDAAVVAIPLKADGMLSGLTELNDALALGKPVVATRSRFFDVDIERVGCGVWVERGDVDGWRRALEELWADPDRRAAMGEAGRRFAEREWNAGVFAAQLHARLVEIAGA